MGEREKNKSERVFALSRGPINVFFFSFLHSDGKSSSEAIDLSI